MTTSSDQAPGAFAGKAPIRAGFTLVELTIVIAVIGVLLAAVFLLFQAGGRAADRVTASVESAIDSRRAVDALEAVLTTAGCRRSMQPGPGWHPISVAQSTMMQFDGRSSSGLDRMITVRCLPQGGFEIMEGGSVSFESGPAVGLRLSYRDATGTVLGEDELRTPGGRDMIRRIDYVVVTGTGEKADSLTGSCTPPSLSL